jgi:hypothetical protein
MLQIVNTPGELAREQQARIAFEQYRLEVVQGWPESERKRRTLAAIRATIASLEGRPEPEPRPNWLRLAA